MDKELFDDLITGLNEALEHERGNIKLKSTIVTIPDDEIEFNQIVFQKLQELPKDSKQKAMIYIDELLKASNQ